MNILDILAAKRDGGELTTEQIGFFVRGLVAGDIPDYQASAWLMAVYLRGLNERETLDMTLAMRDSGAVLDLSDLPNGPALDKHSTGGVGDKTTLVVVPMLAASGIPILKMSGRGLGFSGGTIDKLESIPGFRTELTIAEAKAQVARIGAALIAQSTELAPADGILYALRDATATVDCLPLIASSIMSKKLASGAAQIVLDVKVGRGAFMRTRAEAEKLARAMIAIGQGASVPTSALLTAMDEPLGTAIGNALEVREALELLQNPASGEPRFRSLCLELAAHSLRAMHKADDPRTAMAMAESLLNSGRAAAKLGEIVAAQGGPNHLEAIAASLPVAPHRSDVLAEAGGMVAAIDAEDVGRLAVAMGAGRTRKGAAIDPAVGIVLHRKVGQTVERGDTLATLHLRESDAANVSEFARRLLAAYRIAPFAISSFDAPPVPPGSLVIATLPT